MSQEATKDRSIIGVPLHPSVGERAVPDARQRAANQTNEQCQIKGFL